MLKPSEFLVGSVEHAESLTLVLPCKSYDNTALIFFADDKKWALFLDGDDNIRYHFVECDSDAQVGGVLIRQVEIEIDPASALDGDNGRAPRGSLIRHGESISVLTTFLRRSIHLTSLEVISKLPKGDRSSRCFFTRWQIVLGQGHEKRILHAVNVTPER